MITILRPFVPDRRVVALCVRALLSPRRCGRCRRFARPGTALCVNHSRAA